MSSGHCNPLSPLLAQVQQSAGWSLMVGTAAQGLRFALAAELSKREARWREAARHLATHRQRVAELLQEEGAESGDDWAWEDDGSDEETEALLAKYAAVAPAWDVSDEESS